MAGADEAEYDLLFAVEFPAVVRTVALILHDVDAAQDVTQEAFIRLLRHWRKVSHYDRPGSWVRRVAVNLAVDHLRKEGRRWRVERQAAPVPVAESSDVDVLRAIRSLPAMQRAAVVLHYFEGLPSAEIAHVLGCAEPTVRVHIHRARRHLADLLGEEVTHDVP